MKKFSFALLLILLFSWTVSAETIVFTKERGSNNLNVVEDNLFSRSAPSLVFDCNISSMEANVLDTPKGKFTHIYIPRYYTTSEVGAPMLPAVNEVVEIPHGAKVDIKVVSYTEKEFTLKELGIEYPIYPCQPSLPKDGTKSEFVCNPDAYKSGYAKTEMVKATYMGKMRSRNLAFMQIFPISYNPAEGKIKVYTNIKVELMLPGSDADLTAGSKAASYSPYFDGASRGVLVPESLKTLAQNAVRGRSEDKPVYLIVAHEAFKDTLATFVTFKNQSCTVIEKYYADGVTTTTIQDDIKALYDNAATRPVFMLFVGDHTGGYNIPAFSGKAGSHITDLYYATTDGTDNLPDIIYGRFSAQTVDQLVPQIEKTMTYAATPNTAEFLTKYVLTAGWDYSHSVKWGYPQIRYATKYYFNTTNGYVAPVEKENVFLSAKSGDNVAAIKALAKEGCAIINYTAHGSSTSWADPSYTISDINAMTNEGKYPLVIGNCCLTNKFEVGTCFGEAWLRAEKKGAIGYIGGSNSTYWDEDLWWGNGYYALPSSNANGDAPAKEDTTAGFYEAIFGEFETPNAGGNYSTKYLSNALFMIAGNMAVEKSTSPRKLYYWEVYHLMGDPSLRLILPVK